jgi:hypothetical protein
MSGIHHENTQTRLGVRNYLRDWTSGIPQVSLQLLGNVRLGRGIQLLNSHNRSSFSVAPESMRSQKADARE